MVTAAVATVHVLVGAVWLGAMTYSLGVVQPRARRFFADLTPGMRDYEDFATTVAAGARWKVIAMIAVLAASGAGLAFTAGAERRSATWWALVGVKIGLLAVASAVFWYVSWRMWPRRVFALASEAAGHQRAFMRVGGALVVLVGAATVAGIVAAHLGR